MIGNGSAPLMAVVVTVAAVILVLVHGYDDGINHVLRHCALLPALAEKFMEFGEQHSIGTVRLARV